MLVANVDGEVKFLKSEDTLLCLLAPSSYLIVAVAGAAFEEECPGGGDEDVNVVTGWSDDAASKIIDNFVIKPEAWVESAEASA